ncbi:hypothetical protein AB2M62_08385 [Sphingomonas sp. MMS12-HWE2-04]|uniref:hypothetical protein n=1 Tax=Sphingomonas sp. MMS12-HWE2-04 TaxID=3234199 RepID=UPI00384B0530
MTTKAAQPPATQTPAVQTSAPKKNELTENPLALVAGGVALGALVGALLPRSAKERELLEPLGRNLAERATAAAQAAKDAGRQEIDSLLPDRDATREKVSALFGSVVEAAKGANQKV